jgi:hypothetical protein
VRSSELSVAFGSIAYTRDQLQSLADVQPEDIVETIRSLEL